MYNNRCTQSGSAGDRTYSGVLDVDAHLRRLANTVEPFVCGGDAALYQIALPTCQL